MDKSRLTKCSDCGCTVSINAYNCPHCGAKLKERTRDHVMSFIIAVVVIILLFGFFFIMTAK